MRTLLTIVLSLALASIASAQTPITDAPYALAAGVGFNRADTPQFKGWATFAARVSDKTYSLSTLDMTSANSSLRTGVARAFYSKDNFTFLALVDGGVVTGQSQVGGAVSGGGLLLYDLAKWSKVPGTFAIGGVKIVQMAGYGLSPAFSFGIGRAF